MNSKLNSLLAFLSHLSEKGYNFDAICLQETWVSPESDTLIFNIPGYHLIHQGKCTCSKHLDKFSDSITNIEVKSELWDGKFADVYRENLEGKITVGNTYRPPRSNNNNVTLTLRKFISEIDPMIIAHEKNCSIIRGDFNINLLQINERVENQKYFDLFVTRCFRKLRYQRYRYVQPFKQNLKSSNLIPKKTIRQTKIYYCANQFNQSKSNIRHTWSAVKEI